VKRVLVTGTAGFIGYKMAKLLLDEGFEVYGIDAITDYYDINLKRRRHQMLLQISGCSAMECWLEEDSRILEIAYKCMPDVMRTAVQK
jgi:UDP-glucuronate 4-epimerase